MIQQSGNHLPQSTMTEVLHTCANNCWVLLTRGPEPTLPIKANEHISWLPQHRIAITTNTTHTIRVFHNSAILRIDCSLRSPNAGALSRQRGLPLEYRIRHITILIERASASLKFAVTRWARPWSRCWGTEDSDRCFFQIIAITTSASLAILQLHNSTVLRTERYLCPAHIAATRGSRAEIRVHRVNSRGKARHTVVA